MTEQIKGNGTDGNSYRTHGNGWEQAGMSREGRRTIENVRENTVRNKEKGYQAFIKDYVNEPEVYCLLL